MQKQGIRVVKNRMEYIFAFICFPFPLLIISRLITGHRILDSPQAESVLWFLFMVGFLFVLIDLWRSGIKTDEKGWWTLSLVLLSFVLLPYYWFYRFRISKHKFIRDENHV